MTTSSPCPSEQNERGVIALRPQCLEEFYTVLKGHLVVGKRSRDNGRSLGPPKLPARNRPCPLPSLPNRAQEFPGQDAEFRLIIDDQDTGWEGMTLISTNRILVGIYNKMAWVSISTS